MSLRLLCSPKLSVLFPSNKRKMGPFKSLSSLCSSREPWLNNTFCILAGTTSFISYRTQEAKSAVSSFRVMDFQNTIRLESSAVRSFPTLWTEQGRSRRLTAWSRWHQGPVTTTVTVWWYIRRNQHTPCLNTFPLCLDRHVWINSFYLWEDALFYSLITPRREVRIVIVKLNDCVQQPSSFPELLWVLPQSRISSEDKILELSIH